MKVFRVSIPNDVDAAVDGRVDKDVTAAFQAVSGSKPFVVNDTLWYAKNNRSNITPCVVNAASYISCRFLRALGSLGWTEPKDIANQEIDAYIELTTTSARASIEADKFPLFSARFSATSNEKAIIAKESMPVSFARLYHAYVARPSGLPSGVFDRTLVSYFKQQGNVTSRLRIGLEFETGNIASSFRAINKLIVLHDRGLIDAGIFITSIDKGSCACRVWPQSNRNGSFEEKGKRGSTAH